jgi:mannosyltransferase
MSHRTAASELPTVRPAHAPARLRARLPLRAPERWWEIGVFLLVLLAVSAALRVQAIDAALWADEGISQGIGSKSLSGVLEALHKDGSPPLYYLLLHVWLRAFGDGETALHALSLVFALACVPAALWAGWIMFGRRAGLIAATLAAFNPYLSAYAQEARMYTLVSFLGIVASATFVQAFVRRDRRAVPAFGVALALLAYTHNWGLFFAAAAAGVLALIARRAPDRRQLVRDGLLAFGGAALLYLPWLPTLVGQAMETGAPWATRPGVTAPLQIATGLFGGAGPAVALLGIAGVGIVALLRGADRAEAHSILALIGLAAGTLVVAWLASQVSPAWTGRYFGAVLGALLLAAAAGSAQAGRLGLLGLALVIAFWIPAPSPTALTNKSNADVLATVIAPRLRPGDYVLSTQPEQVPLLRYYLPAGLRYADPRGPVGDPRVMDWRNALEDLRRSRPAPILAALLRRVPPGGQLLFVAPVTDQRRDWRAPWTKLVRRRAAQWGALLEADPGLRPVATAPTFYRTALTVGLRAVLYRKITGSPR